MFVPKIEESQQRFFQDGTALSRVLTEAPYYPRCSDDKTATRVRPREYAIRYPYMQVNRPGFVSWLIFDLDHSHAMRWEDVGLPAPNLIVRNRQSGKSHLFYAIVPVCTTEAARDKPIAYMKAIYEAMAARLDADRSFHSGPVAKTPGHRWWLTDELHAHEYELGELADHVELERTAPWAKQANVEDVAQSRHCILFELLRHYAYSIVNRERSNGTFEGFSRLLDAFAHNHNSFHKYGFAENLPLSSLRSTVRSVARWTWTYYKGSGGCHRGVMQLDDSLPLQVRQRMAAERTHGRRHQATESKIRGACRQLLDQGVKLTQTAVAKVARLSRQTVASYKHLLESALQPAPVATLETVRAQQSTVKYGAHQVPAGSAVGVEPGVFDAGPVNFGLPNLLLDG
jgi:hypothetical protein